MKFLNPSTQRWNTAADNATASGLLPGSHEWMNYIRNELDLPLPQEQDSREAKRRSVVEWTAPQGDK